MHSTCAWLVSGSNLSTHHRRTLIKSSIPSEVLWPLTKNDAFGGKQNEKSNDEQSDFCDIEQVIWIPQLPADHGLITCLQLWYHT